MGKEEKEADEKYKEASLALEEQIKLLVKTEIELRRAQSELVKSKAQLVEYNRTLEQKIEERTKELNESGKRFKDIALSVVDWIWEIDKNSRYTYCSEKIKDIVGFTSEEMIGKTPYDYMAPDEAARVKKIISDVVQKKGIIKDMENWHIAKDGRRVCLLTNGVLLFNENGEVMGYRGVDKDITAQKLAEEEKRKLNDKLTRSEKIAAVGQMTGGIAHEINNPLGVILGFAQILCKKIKESDPLYMPAQSIVREALRCKKLVTDLLTFSMADQTVSVIIDPITAIEETLPRIEAQAKKRNIEIVRNYGQDTPKILAVKDKLQQVILGLCSNAVDAMPNGGNLTITIKKIDRQVAISIADTGEGMTEEVQKHIFEPFFTTKEVGRGTGLGLSLSYEMIRSQRGTIEFTSESGKGATFIVKLPMA